MNTNKRFNGQNEKRFINDQERVIAMTSKRTFFVFVFQRFVFFNKIQ